MYLRNILFLLLCAFLFGSCKSKKEVVTYKKRVKKERVVISDKKEEIVEEPEEVLLKKKEVSKNATYAEIVETYIDNYKDIAMQEMISHEIPASITLAQGILESGAGRANLTKKSNNHFGIKCHKGWTGERVYHDDDESQECFRKYKNPDNSFIDHSLFLTQRSRYKDLFTFKLDDYKSWAKGLRKAGYATDPKYPSKLISIIERYELFKFDEQVSGKNPKKKKKEKVAKRNSYVVKKGDTLYSISKRFNITVKELKSKNRLRSNEISIGQSLSIK
ncbi:MAG: flagellum-specific peptidoglycan hydrolase FlgJ [Flavobacteriaceae bacterium]|jgi:flagellum-specific peptidoglycan hydrolase FlgJ|uniref:glucosaminidase domain-containing protein n=1 Tax=Candidatus Marifrigoribacter sp. Uisw_064 TaxID=3230970 RepID=UPI003AEB76F2